MKSEITRDEKHSVINQYKAAIVVNMLCISQGCCMGWVSPSLPYFSGSDSPLKDPLTPNESYIVASVACVSGTLFTPVFGWVADKFGRKTGLLIGAIPFLLCWIIKLTWYTSTGLILARFLFGIGGAVVYLLAPMYCIEIASIDVKGALGSLMTFSINGGIVVMYTLGVLLSYQNMIITMIPLPILFGILMLQMPESPSYLVKIGKIEEAAKSLSWLRSVPSDSSVVTNEIEYLKREKDMDSGKQSMWSILCSSRPVLKAFISILLLMIFQAFMGVFAVITFAEDIFDAAGTSISPAACSIVLGSLLLLGSCCASTLIERFGRKILLITSSLIVALTMIVMALYFKVQSMGFSTEGYEMVPVVALSLNMFTFSVGAGPIPYILPSEIFMVQMRGALTSVIITADWFFSFLLTLCYGPAVVAIGISEVFFFFGFTSISVVLVTVFCIPETKGKTAEESLAYYDKKSQKILNTESN